MPRDRIGWRRRQFSQFGFVARTPYDSRARRLRESARSRVSHALLPPPLRRLFVLLPNYRRDPTMTDRRRGVHVANDARITVVHLAACCRTRETRNIPGQVHRGGHLVARLSRLRAGASASAAAPTEIWRADWPRRRGPFDRRAGHVAISGGADGSLAIVGER